MEVKKTEDISKAEAFLETKGGRKEKIRDKNKKTVMYHGITLALETLGIPEEEVVELYAGGIRHRWQRILSNKKLPEGFSFSQVAAMAWVLGKHTPEEIAVYIVEQYKKSES